MLVFGICAIVAILSPLVSSQTDPIITSWVKSTGYTGYNKLLTNVNKIQYSSNYVYVSASCIPSYSIGPWPSNPNTPKDMNFTFQIYRYPKEQTSTKKSVPLGHIGLWTNGVSVFNADDGMTYNNSGIWKRNAFFWEGKSFDNCSGHADGSSEYHHHVTPVCLFNSTDSSKHSQIIGFAFDGFPIYGPFGYTNATDSKSAIKRMRSSYRTRNITTRTTLVNGTVLSSSQYGPAVSTDYPIGCFLDDYEYVKGYGDLDEYNGRYGITPDYPNGTYAYFITTDTNGTGEYPFIIGPYFYGVALANFGPTSGKTTINETVTVYYDYFNSTVTTTTTATTVKIVTNESSFMKYQYSSFLLLFFR